MKRFFTLSFLCFAATVLGAMNWTMIVPGVTYSSTKSGSFSGGSSQYVDFGNIMDEDGSNAFSVSFWVRPINTGMGNFPGVIGKQTAGYQGWSIYGVKGSQAFYMYLGNNGSNYIYAYANAAWVDDTWQHYTFTYDGSKTVGGIKGYYNGSATAMGPTTGGSFTSSSTSGTQQIGWVGADQKFNGKLDDVVKWPCVLSAANVTELYNSGRPVDITTLSFYGSCGFSGNSRSLWAKFEDSWDDSSSNAYTGTPINSPTFSTDVP